MVKRARLINYLISSISIYTSLFIFLNSYDSEDYKFYFLVPLVFGVLTLLPNINYTNIKLIGPFILNVSMVIKYIIVPCAASLSNYYSIFGTYPGQKNTNIAVFYIIYEMITVIILSNYLTKLNEKLKKDKNDKHYRSFDINCRPLNGRVVHMVIIAIGIIVALVIPETLKEFRFIFNQDNLTVNVIVDFPFSGLFKTIIYFARYAAILLIFNALYKENMKRKNLINVFGCFSVILINATFISNLSRIDLLVPIITFSVLMLFMFNTKKERKSIVFILGSIFIIGLVYLSIFKFFGEGRGDINNSSSILWWGDTLNMYFSGAKEIAIGMNTIPLIDQCYGWSRYVFLLVNDVFSNVIGISNFTVPILNSTHLYNFTYFGSFISVSQIVPNICEGVYYFGWIFAPVWTCLFVYLAYRFSQEVYVNPHIDVKFAYIYASIYCGMVLMINSSMIISNLTNVTLLFLLLAYMNRIVRLRVKTQKHNL